MSEIGRKVAVHFLVPVLHYGGFVTSAIAPWAPYEGRASMPSHGRITLISAFADLIKFSAGFQPYELSEIFAAPEDDGENDAARDLVCLDANRLTRKFLFGDLAAYARPMNGGDVTAIPSELWEIDDPLPRFATGAFNLDDWANSAAPPTHRIFVDSQQFDRWFASLRAPGLLSNREVEAIIDPQIRAKRSVAAMQAADTETSNIAEVRPIMPAEPPGVGPVVLSIEGVMAMVSLGRSTIYAKMNEGKFPEGFKLGSSTRWFQTEILAWINEQASNRAR